MFKGVPMKIVVPIIVITWVLSLISSLAIVAVVPGLLGIKAGVDEGAILTVHLADGSVTSAKILDGTITAQDMADGSIVTVKVADGTITTAKIVDGAVTEAKIADSAIITAKLADESVTTAKLADNAVVTIKLADGAVTSAKILDGTITAADLADGSVTTTKIADYAVTDINLAAGAIPHNETVRTVEDTTTSPGFVDIPGASVDITLNRNSTLIITFSAMTWLSGTGTYDIYWRAMVNSTQANPRPGDVIVTKSTEYGSHSYTFYLPDVEPGKYTVKMQWRLFQISTVGHIHQRTLVVIALPT